MLSVASRYLVRVDALHCRFHVAAGEKLHADKQFIWRPCPECRKASKYHLLKFSFVLLVRLNLGFITEGNLLLCSSTFLLGFPTGCVTRTIKHFFGTVAGEKEDFCKGSLSSSIFYFVIVLLYFIFTCIVLSKIQKK
jgi:hypothetical protein